MESLTDEPDAIFAPGRRVFQGTHEGVLFVDLSTKQPRELVVTGLRPFKEGFLITFEAIRDRTEAEKWNGRYLMVPVTELSEPDAGEVFAHELVGMQLVDADSGTAIGEVVEFYDLPQGLLLEFRTATGLISVPFVDEFVDEVDREGRTIRVRLPDGLLEG